MRTFVRLVPTSLAFALAATTSLAWAAPAEAAPPSAEKVIERLKSGHSSFAAGKATHPDQDPKRVAATAAGQHPFVTVLSCSDSRVPPELLFDQGVGSVFTVRV